MTAIANTHKPALRGRRFRRPRLGKVLGWITVAVLIVITVFPFYWMLRTALSSQNALYTDSSSLLPVDFSWGGFRRALGLATQEEALADGGTGASVELLSSLRNSVIVATCVAVVQVLCSLMAAYAFARLKWRGRDVVFTIFLAGLMVPGIFTLIPNFLLIKDMGLLDTLPGVMLPTLLMTPFAIFFLRQSLLGINEEIEEAARLDGAGPFRIFFHVVMPMVSSTVMTLVILTYIAAWNDYMWPLLVSSTSNSRVLTLALGTFYASSPTTGPDWPGLMAATLIAAAPMLLLFVVFGRRIVDSIGSTGIK